MYDVETKRDKLQKILEEKIETEIKEVTGVVLIRNDGLVIASTRSISEAEAEKIGGLSAAILGMAIRINKFLNHGSFNELVLKSEDGILYIRKIFDELGVILSVKAKKDIPLGYLLVIIENASEEIKKILKEG